MSLTTIRVSVIGLLLLSVVAFRIRVSCGHPQCLDFRPPFESTEKLFCSDYEDFGCCSLDQDDSLRLQYDKILREFGNEATIDQKRCSAHLKNILCQECSPYAAHIYDAEDDRVKRPFPGLCKDYCADFYDKCKSLIPYITNDTGIAKTMVSREQFCTNLTLTDVDYCYPDWINQNVLNESISRQTRTEEGCLCLEPFAPETPLRNALSFRYPPDNSGRIFISEQIGVVQIFYKNQTKLQEPFMDLSDVVLSSSSPGDERGFLNLAFHPKFADNGKFYVYFSISDEALGKQKIRISEFRVSENDGNKVNRSSERVIIEVDQPYWNHNGGELLFGVDGYLYAFLGDGGAGGDPQGNGQNKGTLLGSVLRLDVDDNTSTRPYGIPDDNPFVNENGSRPEIFAYGIRNIWRCDVDEGDPETGYGRGRIICGDVGQGAYEEIDIIKKGRNYGWNAREGFECYRKDICGKIGPEELPIYAYSHAVGKSVTGGHVYRGCLNPNLQGFYIYGDYVNGKLFRLKETVDSGSGESSWENKELTMCGEDVCFNGLVSQYERNILSFGEDDDGEIYMLSTNFASSTYFGSKIYKFVDPRRRGDPTKCRSYQAPKSTAAPTTTADDNQRLPQAPSIVDVSLNVGDNTAVDVTWNYRYNDNYLVLYYILQYKIVSQNATVTPDEGWTNIHYAIPRDRWRYTIRNLLPSNKYQFRISAANSVGVGPFSTPSRIIKLTLKPPSSPPQNVMVYGYLRNNIVVRWSPPVEQSWNGPLFGYVVRYKLATDTEGAPQYKTVYNHRITAEIITGLKTNAEYEISVAAFNAAGIGQYSNVSYAWTMESTPNAPPLDVTTSPTSSTSVKVTWMPPNREEARGVIRGYVLRAYRVNTTRPEVERRVYADISNMFGRQQGYINGLNKYTEYKIKVSCYTAKGEGPQSRPVTVKTLEDVPGKVTSLRFDKIRMNSFEVIWNPPEHTNGIIQGYTLIYEESNLPTTRVTKSLSPNTLSYTAEGLLSNKLYTVILYASTTAGNGPMRTAYVQTISPSPAYLEICHMDSPMSSRTLSCGPGLVIQQVSASYGRMKLGECIRDNFGSIGCRSDVTSIVRQFCGGKTKCILHDWFLLNRIMVPDNNITCPGHLPKYLQVTYRCGNDPCNSKPCQNGGLCTASEDPYNIGYYCYCGENFGGRHCQIADPCKTHPCPQRTTHRCVRVMSDDVTGRVCYNKKWRIIGSDIIPPLFDDRFDILP